MRHKTNKNCLKYPFIFIYIRSGITTGYQERKISYLRQLGVEIEVLALSVNSQETAKKLLEHALKLGPVGGIFNMAAVRKIR